MSRLVVLSSKDPIDDAGGDVAMTRLLLSLAPREVAVEILCLSRTRGPGLLDLGGRTVPVTRVEKPPPAAHRLAVESLRTGRSLVHTRFDVPALRHRLRHLADEGAPDAVLAEHTYMAESWLALDHPAPLLVDTHVSESDVWRSTRGAALRHEAHRIRRDELRVVRAATRTATFDPIEADRLRAATGGWVEALDISLPPLPAVDIATTPRRLVFLGDRRWPPNARAAEQAVRLWSRLRERVPDAELLLVGAPPARSRTRLPDGVRDLGFVPDLDAVLGTCRALIAPVTTGGGVRVKILEAVSRGLPVIGSSAALGALDRTFGLTGCDTTEEWISRCCEMLTTPHAAAREGRRLHEIAAQRWHDQVPHLSVAGFLAGVG